MFKTFVQLDLEVDDNDYTYYLEDDSVEFVTREMYDKLLQNVVDDTESISNSKQVEENMSILFSTLDDAILDDAFESYCIDKGLGGDLSVAGLIAYSYDEYLNQYNLLTDKADVGLQHRKNMLKFVATATKMLHKAKENANDYATKILDDSIEELRRI